MKLVCLEVAFPKNIFFRVGLYLEARQLISNIFLSLCLYIELDIWYMFLVLDPAALEIMGGGNTNRDDIKLSKRANV